MKIIKKIILYHREFVARYGFLKGTLQLVWCCIRSFYNVIQMLIARFLIQPDYKKIAFMSYPDYTDSARVLSEYIINELEQDYEVYWLVEDVETNEKLYKDKKVTFLSNKKKDYSYSWKTLSAVYSCGILCYTNGFIFDKKFSNPKQKVINLWHGCGYKAAPQKERVSFDCVLVPGNCFIRTKSEFFGVEEQKIMPIGYPRYDLLKRKCEKAERFINNLKGENKKVVLWMPTFRKTGRSYFPEEINNRDFELPILQSLKELERLDAFCQENKILICIKRHPVQLRYNCEDLLLKNIKFINEDTLRVDDIQLYSILQYTDTLISDYSSISVDYMLLDKPIAYALDDYEQYKNTRGFVFENVLDYMPGHHLYNMNDLYSFLEDIVNERDIYVIQREKIMKEFHNKSDNYCKTVWDKILEI